MSQKIAQYVEIDVDYCALTFGTSPCTATADPYTKILLHMDGADGSRSFPDAALAGVLNQWTATGNVQIDTADSKFGGASAFFDASGSLMLADNPNLSFGSSDFTFDCWFKINVAEGPHLGLFGQMDASTTPGSSSIWAYRNGGAVGSGFITAIVQGDDNIPYAVVTTDRYSNTINPGWHHFALVRSGIDLKLYIDGVLKSSVAFLVPGMTINESSNNFTIGANGEFAANWWGWIDEFRFGTVARWTSNFTPPPAAAVTPTGNRKCFNTLATCQDRANFANAPVTLRFAVPTEALRPGIECIPSIKSIDFDPAVISLGQNLGERATLTINFEDHRHSDSGEGFDKYLADRAYNPFSQGTFFGKFAARQPFLRGRNLRWFTGTLDQALLDYEIRHFVIDSFSGPDNNGGFKLIAKDVLKLADGDRALAPKTSQGFLNAALTTVATTFTAQPIGIGASYPASGLINIGGSEICSFTRSGDVFTIVRGLEGTTASAHNAQDRVQLVLKYNAVSPDIIIADLLTNYAGVAPQYCPMDDWAVEIAAHLNRVYTAVIAQPTSVNTLLSELIEQAGLSLWWNDRDQELGLMVLRGMVYTNYLFTEQNIVADTLEIAEQPEKRLSQVHTYFGQINPLTSLTDKANYRSVSVITDAQKEADYGSPAIKEIFSRWIPQLGRSIADRLGNILIGRFKDPPRKINFSFMRNSTGSTEIVLANGYQVQSWPLQTDTGAPETVNVQVTRLRPNPDLIQVETEEVLFTAPAEDLTTRNIIIDANNYNLNLRVAHDQMYPAPSSGITVVITINAGVKVGSTSTAMAIDVGSWPANVTIIIHVAGRIQGKGGNGGTATAGGAGSVALYTRYAIKLSVNAGAQIYGGGGGGGGALHVDGSSTVYRWGGGGGAGFDPGAGAGDSDGAGTGSGANGTTEAGGVGSGYAGAGGGPGAPGAAGQNLTFPGGAGGAAGAAIDGLSFVTTGTWNGTTFTPGALAGSVLGPQIN